MQESIKPPVEVRYREELEALKNADQNAKKPDNWQMSPKAVRTFILGSEKPIEYQGNKYQIRKKYFGNDALVERCIVTLAGNRGLMLVGEPGTAKTMLSEPVFKHLFDLIRTRRTVMADRNQHYFSHCVDESGSMLDSVIHSAVMAGIFAKLPMLDTRLVIFDTNVVDLSGYASDPVETLMSILRGGRIRMYPVAVF